MELDLCIPNCLLRSFNCDPFHKLHHNCLTEVFPYFKPAHIYLCFYKVITIFLNCHEPLVYFMTCQSSLEICYIDAFHSNNVTS